MAMAMAMAVSCSGLRQLFSSIPAFTQPPSSRQRSPTPTSSFQAFTGLNKRTTTEGLKTACEKFGQVVHARVITDPNSGYSKGFGFVRYATLKEAAEGKKRMDGKYLGGWVIFAEYARPRAPPSPPHGSNPAFGYPSSGYPPSRY